MPTILILTVGGSSAPIVSAIREHHPTFVAFVTSKDQSGPPPRLGSYTTVDGPGEPCDVRNAVRCPSCKAEISPRQAKPSIVAQAGLAADAYQIIQVEPDDLNEAFATLRDLLADLHVRFPHDKLVTDYTGGTKTMSTALALAALERGDCELTLMLGDRPDLQRVADGTQMSSAVDTRSWRVQRSLDLAAEFFDHYDYSAAEQSLTGVIRDIVLTSALRTTIQRRVQLARGFDAWDRFDHATAFSLLEPFAKALDSHWKTLLCLNGRGKTSGYEAVFDLLRNAERRAARARYDDAVARLYRATELFAQIRLQQQYDLHTSDLDLSKLPEALRSIYADRPSSDGKIRLGLQESYALLGKLDDPLGSAFAQVSGPLNNALTRRNQSILAHGTRPMNQHDYHDLASHLYTLINTARPQIKCGNEAPQFPPLKAILP